MVFRQRTDVKRLFKRDLGVTCPCQRSLVRARGSNTGVPTSLADLKGEDPWQDLWFHSNPCSSTRAPGRATPCVAVGPFAHNQPDACAKRCVRRPMA